MAADLVRAGHRAAARILLLLLVLAVWVGAAAAQPGARQFGVEISSAADWTDTGLMVGIGDDLAIEAGSAFFGRTEVPPGGLGEAPAEAVVAPGLPVAALIGRIGEGEPFLVGAAYRRKVAEAGPLQLRWNLRLPQPVEPSAMFMAEIRHVPADADDEPDGNSALANATAVEPDPPPEQEAGAVGNATVAAPPAAGDRPPPKAAAPPAAVQEPRPGISTAAALAAGVAALLLLGVAADGVRRLRRRRLERATRALLTVKPSFDRGGDAGGDLDFDAGGPAVRLRARLERGEGGGDG